MGRDGDGLFERNGVWSFRYRDAMGKWREKSTGHRRRREAWRAKQKFFEALENGNLPSDRAKWTLSQAANEWCDYRSVTKGPKTAQTERRFLKQVVRVLNNNRLARITPHDLERYQVARLKGDDSNKPVGSRTVNYELFFASTAQGRRIVAEFQGPLPPAEGSKTRPR